MITSIFWKHSKNLRASVLENIRDNSAYTQERYILNNVPGHTIFHFSDQPTNGSIKSSFFFHLEDWTGLSFGLYSFWQQHEILYYNQLFFHEELIHFVFFSTESLFAVIKNLLNLPCKLLSFFYSFCWIRFFERYHLKRRSNPNAYGKMLLSTVQNHWFIRLSINILSISFKLLLAQFWNILDNPASSYLPRKYK